MTKLKISTVAWSLGIFLVITYVLCVIFGLLVPEEARMYQAWAPLLPGFVWLDWGSFFLGLVESFLYGPYIAVVFVPVYNYVARRQGVEPS